MRDLLGSWNYLSPAWAGKDIIFFLDYDGTLTPIASSPGEAFLPSDNKDLLERLTKIPSYHVVIISGRCLADIKDKIGLPDIIYIGNHGWEIEDDSMHFESLIPVEVSSAMKKLKYELITQLSDIQGAFVEDKGPTLSVHYRKVGHEKEPLVKRMFDYICMPYRRRNMVRVHAGKKVLEIRPPLDWDKGKAALWLLRKLEILRGEGQVLPIYIGDDTTDEDAFEALRQKGITVLVGHPHRFSAAQYYLHTPVDVTDFLKQAIDGLFTFQ